MQSLLLDRKHDRKECLPKVRIAIAILLILLTFLVFLQLVFCLLVNLRNFSERSMYGGGLVSGSSS